MLRSLFSKGFFCFLFVMAVFSGKPSFLMGNRIVIDAKELTSLKNFVNFRGRLLGGPDYTTRTTSLEIRSSGPVPPQIDWRFLTHFSKTNLKTLFIRDLNLTELPKEIKGLHGLTFLSAQNNRIRTLPLWLKDLSNLETLHLAKNQLTGLPNFGRPFNRLKELDLSYNQIRGLGQRFAHDFPRLKFAILSHNQLKSMPASFYTLRNLEIVDLSFNQIKVIPPQISGLRELTELNLAQNKIQTLPRNFLALEDNLNFLNLSGNPLVQSASQGDHLGIDQLREAFFPDVLILDNVNVTGMAS